MQDSYSSNDGNTYTLDAIFSMSPDGTNWTDTYDDIVDGVITLEDGGPVYFMVSPYFIGETGTYLLDMTIERAPASAVKENAFTSQIRVYPNPAREHVMIDLDAFNGNLQKIELVDATGHQVISPVLSPSGNISRPVPDQFVRRDLFRQDVYGQGYSNKKNNYQKLKTQLFILLIGMSACHSAKQMPMSAPNDAKAATAAISGPPALVYKTRADYDKLVPVIMNDAKTVIVSYPSPNDLKNSQGYLLPVPLKKGYLLDKKGIGKNVAFLNITYEEFAKLSEPPSMEQLEKLILDKDPLVELCDCGNITRFTDPVNQLNDYIKHHSLSERCKTIKKEKK